MQRFNFCFSLINEPSSCFRLKESHPCYDHTSGSAVLSISAFIVQHLPNLRPPTISPEIFNGMKTTEAPEKWQVSYCPLEEPWSNYIINLTLMHHAQYHDHTFFIEIPLIEKPEIQSLSHYFHPITLTQGNLTYEKKMQRIFGLPQIQRSGKRIGIVAYRSILKAPLEPRVNSVGLFLGNLFRNDEWSVFRVEDNQIPTVESLMTFDCVILPGFTLSACAPLPAHINKTIQNITLAYKLSSRLKIIGTCFGHQIIAKYFGAKVEKLGRVGGIEQVNFDVNYISKHQFFNPISDLPHLLLSQHHEDFVTSVPEGFKHIGSSNSCKYEAFLSDDHRILTVQFHSQYYCHFTKRFEQRLFKFCGNNNLKSFYIPESQEIQRKNVQHSQIFMEVFRRFIM